MILIFKWVPPSASPLNPWIQKQKRQSKKLLLNPGPTVNSSVVDRHPKYLPPVEKGNNQKQYREKLIGP